MARVHDKHSPFPMDQGIDKIFRADPDRVDTGSAAEISPAFSPVKPRLEQLYAMPNLEDYLGSQTAPPVNDPSLLLPARFEKALLAAVQNLSVAEEADARNARIFRRAGKLMREQASLRDLVQMYRSALLKG